MDDRELLDHLPALTEALIRVLQGEEETLAEDDARRHGHQRRLDGYSVVDVSGTDNIQARVSCCVRRGFDRGS